MTNDAIRKSTLATLGEIAKGENQFKEQHGIDLHDDDEWQSLAEIVQRIERKLTAKMQEAAE